MDIDKNMSEEDKLKLTVYSAVSKICDDIGKNNTFIGDFDFTVDAKTIITELVWKKMEQYVEDLEAFAQHAKRNQINIEDVKLLFRRNPKILEEITKLEAEDSEKPAEKGRKRKQSAVEVDNDDN
ncbi:centromere protein S [Halyomorpha halys]|uniref:centromere protein S n=1 Tax=Halyomorpha halys TaxID=286706 RepID=UPI0006D4E4BA|nr:centromere protein S-like [Halyomorpha halys]XP_014294103.1 centromere protein S-like [Halyomorpha halys]